MREIILDNNKFQILYDDHRVWVSNNQGDCIGRFDFRFGMDVHKSIQQQLNKNESQCLYCTHGKTDFDGFIMFVNEMLLHHGVEIPLTLFKKENKK